MSPAHTRTWAALLAGYVLALPLVGPVAELLGLDHDQVAAGLALALAAAWHAVARWAEQRWPWASWLLGSCQQPVYLDRPVGFEDDVGPVSGMESRVAGTAPDCTAPVDRNAPPALGAGRASSCSARPGGHRYRHAELIRSLLSADKSHR